MSFRYPIYIGFFQANGPYPHFERHPEQGIFEPVCVKTFTPDQINDAAQKLHLDLDTASVRWAKPGYLEFDGYHLTAEDVALIDFLLATYDCKLIEFSRRAFAEFEDLKERLSIKYQNWNESE